MRRVLIANRGAIAARAIDTFRTLGWSPIAVAAVSDPQRLHTLAADGCEYLQGTGLAQTYDHVGRIVEAARRCGADAVYPGYGALAEDPELPEQLAAAGIAFIGPTAGVLAAARDKDHAVATADRLGLPVLPHATGRGRIARLVKEIGLPVILKPVTGCGGLGVRIVHAEADAEQALALMAADEGGDWYAERYVERGHVVGVTVAVDAAGTVHPLGERESLLVDGSMKLLEASPVQGVAPELLERMRADTAKLVTGTVSYNVYKRQPTGCARRRPAGTWSRSRWSWRRAPCSPPAASASTGTCTAWRPGCSSSRPRTGRAA